MNNRATCGAPGADNWPRSRNPRVIVGCVGARSDVEALRRLIARGGRAFGQDEHEYGQVPDTHCLESILLHECTDSTKILLSHKCIWLSSRGQILGKWRRGRINYNSLGAVVTLRASRLRRSLAIALAIGRTRSSNLSPGKLWRILWISRV